MNGTAAEPGGREGPLACVVGGIDLVRSLGLAGIRCAVVAPEGSALFHSRYAERILPVDVEREEVLIESLVRFGTGQARRPVLYFDEDTHLLMVSRHRKRLAAAFRFTLPDAELIEKLVDKGRFQEMAEAMSLPVPRARRLHPTPATPELDLQYPFIIKPLTRLESWKSIAQSSKAIRVDRPTELHAVWPSLWPAGIELLAQELIPGPETRIESYHVYVDDQGQIAGEFTGRKIRTYPAVYGHSSALTVTDSRGEAADVAALGAQVSARIGLRGVAKFDFKRAPDGSLHLLEINARFNLWHHLGAAAGVNLPALVYADLTGRARPPPSAVRPGVCWCRVDQDRLAAREAGLSTASWLAWVARCEARSISVADPMPFLMPRLARLKRMLPAIGGLHGRPGSP
jgi:D-aspartate ligase